MNYLNDDDLNLDDELKYSNGIQNIGDQMARLVFSKNKSIKIDENNLLFTYDDFYKKNPLKAGIKKKSINSINKNSSKNINTSDYSNKPISKGILKNNIIKKSSFNNIQSSLLKKPCTDKKIKFSKITSQDNKINENKVKENVDKKKNIEINKKKINDIENNENIKNNCANPKKIQFFKFINKKSKDNNKNNEEPKNSKKLSYLVPSNLKLNQKNININDNNNNSNMNIHDINKNNIINNSLVKISQNDIRRNSDTDEDFDNIDIEIIKPDFSNSSIETNNNINKLNKNNFITIKGKKTPDHIYYLQMKNLQKKSKNINKKRTLIIEEKLSHMQSAPTINQNTINIISKMKKEYVPIQERAAQIHSSHITQNILYEIQKKIKKENEEHKELEIINLYKPNKTYSEKEWNNFVERQNQWEKEKEYKRKAEEIFKDEVSKKYYNRPYLNNRSRNIINKIIKKNSSMDNVYTRLYNDLVQREERQKSLNTKYIPTFKPKPSKFNYKKFINKNDLTKNKPDLVVTNYNKSNYFLDSQISINKGLIFSYNYNKYSNKINKCKYCYYKNYFDKNSYKSKSIQSNNSFIYKSTNINTIGFFSKNGADDSFLQTESCISNKNRNYFYNIKEFNHSLDDNNLIKVKRQRHIRLNRCIFKHNISNYNDFEDEKQIYKDNDIYEKKIYNNKKYNMNRTININDKSKRYKIFFNFENIEDL